jgi:hypothetical protein
VSRISTAAVVVALLLSTAAHAQPKTSEPVASEPADGEVSAPTGEIRRRDGGYLGRDLVRLEIDDCPPPPALERRRLEGIAAEHYDRGRVLYKQGDYPGAVHEFVAAYCLFPATYTLLADIGQAYERSLDYARAVGYLERYVLAIPEDARKAGVCDPDPLEDKRNVSARIQVLQSLPASLQIATMPQGAVVTMTSATGVRAQERADAGTIDVVAGRYTMTVELAGYESVSREVDVEIGKPYSFFFALAPKKGHLTVQTIPGDARVFLDDRLVGLGGFDAEFASGTYEMVVEASGRLPERRRVEVVADRETRIAVRLAEPPASGRTQLLIASSLSGLIAGAVGFGVLDEGFAGASVGAGIGLGVGTLGAYYGIPRDITVGTSSFIITAGLAGAVEGGTVAGMITDSDTAVVAAGFVGVIGGATLAALGSRRLKLDAGDAALINSGAIWGTAAGGLLTTVFENDPDVQSAVVFAGLNVGLVSGALLASRFDWSRGHVALVDLAGLGGAAVAVALQAAIDAEDDDMPTSEQDEQSQERQAHFALAGMTIGLIAGGFLTRDWDVRKLPVRPTTGTATGASGDVVPTFGVAGDF